LAAAEDERRASDTSKAALVAAGLLGIDEEDKPSEEVKPDDEDKHVDVAPEFEFEGKPYKTEAAMKAAITRSKNKKGA